MSKTPEFSQEFRLGLVVYGGVSLAIYMNGICREFYEAVRGRGIYKLIKALTDSDIVVDVVSGTSAGGINGILLSYALSNSEKDRAVEFKDFASIWRDSGDISRLMRPVDPFNITAEVNSLLDGEDYYQQALEKALKTAAVQEVGSHHQEWYSASSELDLFVTGTDILGKVYNTFDNTGKVIEVKDHRCVFHLKHRKGRKEPFATDPGKPTSKDPADSDKQREALAKLCRITSCFPVAFPVVCVDLDSENDADAKLVEWGALKNRNLHPKELVLQGNPRLKGRQLYFVDGGVLDNRPFGYTIQEIYHRTAYRPVSRKLFYIDPSPDRFFESDLYKKMPKPSLRQVIGDSLVGMPRYESIANDLRSIEDHNQKVRRYRRLMEAVQDIKSESSEENTRGEANQKSLDNAEYLYLRCRFIELRDRILPLILQTEKFAETDKNTANQKDAVQGKRVLLERAAVLLTQPSIPETERKNREEVLRDLTREIRNLDVEYALRKHFSLLERTWSQMSELLSQWTVDDEAPYQKLKFLAGDVSQHIEILEVTQAALNYMLQLDSVNQTFKQVLDATEPLFLVQSADKKDVVSQPVYQVYEYFLRLHRFLLDANSFKDFANLLSNQLSGEGSSPPYGFANQNIADFYEQLKQRARELDQGNVLEILKNYKFEGNENDNDHYRSILRVVELRSEALIQQYCPAPSGEVTHDSFLSNFRNFRNLDQVLYSFEYLADFRSKETIELYRVSPEDANRGYGQGKGLDQKLAGDQLRAFGGFFKKSWRSNDILWGRLDGLNRLVDALVTEESLKSFQSFVKRQCQGKEPPSSEEYLEYLVAETLPASATVEEKTLLKGYLEILAQGQSLTSEGLEKFLNLLVTLGHREIVNAGLKDVLEDDLKEQLEWEVQRQVDTRSSSNSSVSPLASDLTVPNTTKRAQKYRYDPVTKTFSDSITSLVVQSMIADAMNQINDQETFFNQDYKVGSETLTESVPPIVLKNLMARTGLLLRDVIVNLPVDQTDRDAIAKLGVFQVINRGLQLFYVLISRRSPKVLKSAKGQNLSLINTGFILLFITLAGVVVLTASLAAILLSLPIWGLPAIAATIVLIGFMLLILLGSGRPPKTPPTK